MSIILAEWFDWNYGRKQGEPYWISQSPAVVLTMKETAKSYIVRYGQHDLRKILPKLKKHSSESKTSWIVRYGTHERLTYTKIVFTLQHP